jgi:transcriptional antiterminator RfaH
MNNFHAGWYLMYTRPRHEKKVHAGLKEMDISSILPMRKTLRVWHDRKKIVDEPLFPSYVFVYLDSAQHYYDGMDTEGVLYLVKSGKEPARVSESVINNLRLVTEQDDSEIEVSAIPFLPGQRMVISSGALTGLSCEVISINDRKKLLVRVDLLQRNLLLSMPAESLVAI